MRDAGRWVVVAGVAVAVLGLVMMAGGLPGDLSWRRGNVRVYVPIATSIVLSIVLTVVVNLLRR